MAAVGDKVTVTIGGEGTGGTVVSDSITVASGKSLAVRGKIIEDRGDSWLIELDLSVDGKNRLLLSKSAQR
jgi:hypothetical protein